MENIMQNDNVELDTNLYDVIFFWDKSRKDRDYKQYCAETLCNILGYTPALSVKLIYEASEKGKTLLVSTRNIDKATIIRDTLLSMEMMCQICPNEMARSKKT